jgi:hypothetical protein
LELNKLKSELGLTKDSRITYDMLLNKIEKGGTDDLTIRCFFLVLFSTLLSPGTRLFITGRQAAMARSTDELKTINWAKVVVDGIRAAVNKWHTRGSTEKRSSICCCATFMMVCDHCYIFIFLYHSCICVFYAHSYIISYDSCIYLFYCAQLYYLDHLNYVNALPLDKAPRAAFYDTKLVKEIIKSDEGPNHTFGKLNVGLSFHLQLYLFYFIFILDLTKSHHFQFKSVNNSCYSIATGDDVQFMSLLEGMVEGLDENIRNNEAVKELVAEARRAHSKVVEAYLEHKKSIDASFLSSLNNLVKEFKVAADNLVEKHIAAADAPPAKVADSSVEKPTADASLGHAFPADAQASPAHAKQKQEKELSLYDLVMNTSSKDEMKYVLPFS